MLRNATIQRRVVLALAIPIALLMGLAGYDIHSRLAIYSEMASLDALARDFSNLSRLVHELQRERGLSAILIGSKGAQMRGEVAEQRKRTDQELVAAAASLQRLASSSDAETRLAAGKAQEAVGNLGSKRGGVDSLSLTGAESAGYYTQTIARLFDVAGMINKAARDPDVVTSVSAYSAFVQGKERAGQERAHLGGGIAAGKFDLAGYSRAITLSTAQDVYFGTFNAAATKPQREFAASTLSGPVVDNVATMRKTIVDGSLAGDFKGIDGKTWFDTSTARIDLLKKIEDRLSSDLLALASQKQSDAAAQLGILAGLLLLALAISCGVAIMTARGITRPLSRLSEVMKTLAEGDMAVAIEGTARSDEIGTMARAVQFFKESMIKSQALTASEAAAMQERSERAARVASLTESFDKAIASVLRSVSAASTELEATARAMSQTASETAQKTATVATSTGHATDNVQTVAAAAEEMTGSVGEIGRQVTQSSSVARKAVEEADRTNRTVVGLSASAEKIGGVVKLINEIAGQTNLLALNATIEAARAGEAGKGFAVVAAEVKTLADQTAKATGEISMQITAIQDSSADAVQAIQAITATINEISEITASIASAVTEQSAATEEIARNVQEAAIGTREIADSISGVTQATEQTGAAAQQVLAASQELSQQSEAMRAEVEGFLADIRAA